MPFNRIAFAFLAAVALLAPAAAQDTKVRVAYVPVIGAAPLFVLAGSGEAKAAGLDVSLVRFDSGPPAISAVASGTIDVLVIGVAPVAVARAKGLDVRIVAASSTGGSAFVASPSLAKNFDAARGDPVRALADFHAQNKRPAKLATLPSGGVPNVALHHWLFRLNAVKREDAQIVTLGIDAVQQSILTGGVDGATVLEPSLTIVQQRNPGLKPIVTATEMFEAIPGVVVAVTGAFARAHPEAVDKLVALTIRASATIASDPLKAAGWSQNALGGGLVEAATLARSLGSKAVTFVTDPAAIEEPTRRMLAWQVELGDFDKAPPMDGLFDKAPYLRVTGGK